MYQVLSANTGTSCNNNTSDSPLGSLLKLCKKNDSVLLTTCMQPSWLYQGDYQHIVDCFLEFFSHLLNTECGDSMWGTATIVHLLLMGRLDKSTVVAYCLTNVGQRCRCFGNLYIINPEIFHFLGFIFLPNSCDFIIPDYVYTTKSPFCCQLPF